MRHSSDDEAPEDGLLERSEFPTLLRALRDAPERLCLQGDADLVHLPCLAIVGSRNPSRGGRDNAYRFAGHLAKTGFCIVSGLAEGIDTAAHEGALDAGGSTIAVLGHGLDSVYPASNRGLADRIRNCGLLLTEFTRGTPPRRGHFPARNRIISGLSVGVLVVEAARRSGSLITARLAGEQGREVFAIPGSIHNPMSRGCHQLIREGARLVESAGDIVSELAPLIGHLKEPGDEEVTPRSKGTLDPDYVRLLDVLGHDPQSADELARKCTLTIDQVSSMLLILELEGEIESLPGGKFSKLSD